jgi:hypothetical protein
MGLFEILKRIFGGIINSYRNPSGIPSLDLKRR